LATSRAARCFSSAISNPPHNRRQPEGHEKRQVPSPLCDRLSTVAGTPARTLATIHDEPATAAPALPTPAPRLRERPPWSARGRKPHTRDRRNAAHLARNRAGGIDRVAKAVHLNLSRSFLRHRDRDDEEQFPDPAPSPIRVAYIRRAGPSRHRARVRPGPSPTTNRATCRQPEPAPSPIASVRSGRLSPCCGALRRRAPNCPAAKPRMIAASRHHPTSQLQR
jgi:hypothetical protein